MTEISTEKDNEDLRDHRIEQYLAPKEVYAAAIWKEKYTTLKVFCTITPITNSWRGINRILAGRNKRAAPETTLNNKK